MSLVSSSELLLWLFGPRRGLILARSEARVVVVPPGREFTRVRIREIRVCGGRVGGRARGRRADGGEGLAVFRL